MIATILATCLVLDLVTSAWPKDHKPRLRDDLESSCYGFPASKFHRRNSVRHKYGESPHLMVKEGDMAVEFTLRDLDGKPVTLSELLKTRPVALIWGMYTCPAFQGLDGGEKFKGSGRTFEWTLVEKYYQHVHFLHLYGPEPHPDLPDLNFDSGAIKLNYWSTEPQAYTYEERLQTAEKARSLVHPAARLLIDDLDGPEGSRNNPVWCTYANGARVGLLVGQDGRIAFAQPWFQAKEFEEALLRVITPDKHT